MALTALREREKEIITNVDSREIQRSNTLLLIIILFESVVLPNSYFRNRF